MITISLFCYCGKVSIQMNMVDWEKFNLSLLEKEDFCSHLNMENFTDA